MSDALSQVQTTTRRRMVVVIVHYKTPAMLADCLETLLPQLDPAVDQLIVVDNASGADQVAGLRAMFDGRGVTFIESPVNLGFAGANNRGIRFAQMNATSCMRKGGAAMEYLVLLNPDTLLRNGALAALRAFLEGHPGVACVGPRLEYPDATPQLSAFTFPAPISELIRGANIGPITRLLSRWNVCGEVRDEPHRADWLAGACIMMRGDMLEKTGLLDERFFMYFEEVDYFRRARKLEFSAWYVPAARVVHLVGQASGIKSSEWAARRLPAYWFESRHRYFRKHFGYLGMLAADLFWLTGHLLMRLRKALTGTSHSAVARSETADLLRHSLRQMLRPHWREAA